MSRLMAGVSHSTDVRRTSPAMLQITDSSSRISSASSTACVTWWRCWYNRVECRYHNNLETKCVHGIRLVPMLCFIVATVAFARIRSFWVVGRTTRRWKINAISCCENVSRLQLRTVKTTCCWKVTVLDFFQDNVITVYRWDEQICNLLGVKFLLNST